MAQHTPHARLLSEAARDTLGPLGLEQRGRTRTWVDDQHWFAGVVEFAADGFARGSCLKVGVMWLWSPREVFCRDVELRAEKFTEFHNKSQFEREAARLAARAAERVASYRAGFTDVRRVAEYLIREHDAGNAWHAFHTAVACGLSGRIEHARTHFDRLIHSEPRADWERRLKQEAGDLQLDAAQPALFRIAIEQRILAARDLLRLPPVRKVDFGLAAALDCEG